MSEQAVEEARETLIDHLTSLHPDAIKYIMEVADAYALVVHVDACHYERELQADVERLEAERNHLFAIREERKQDLADAEFGFRFQKDRAEAAERERDEANRLLAAMQDALWWLAGIDGVPTTAGGYAVDPRHYS